MATYFPGANIQADNMQTLYLMNPGYAGYTDGTTPGNMVLLNHSVGNALPANNLPGGQPSQHFIGIPLPTASLSQRTSVGVMGNSPTAPHDVSSNLFASRIGGHPYNVWQNGGNELTFMQTADAAGSNQSLSGQLNSSGSLGHQSVAEISQLGVRRAPTSSIQEQQSGMLPSGLSLQLEQSHGSTGHGQGLSLSLSPQQPPAVQLPLFQNQATDSDINCPGISATSEENMSRADRSTNKWPGSLTPFRASSRDGMLGASFSSPGFSSTHYGPGPNKQMHLDSTSTGAPGLPNALMGSKYLKAAQQLLEEVVNVGKGIKPDSAKQQKSQSWIGAMVNKENSGTEASGKDGASAASTWPSTSAQEKNDRISELSPAERQELQMKKAKLVAMLDEVDHRYRQYYHQMQIVVASFEAAAGIGAAKTYTALALQTISRHFRCLRDAISGQIRLTSKSLGEEDSTASGKGETSRLRFVDQHLRQQRALQQLGMIQQHAWRPQRGLPERSVSVLRAWLFEHFLHPYPKDNDKVMLARQTGLTRSQVSNWFINARVRLWKPMVEEMYMEEMKECDPERASNEKMSKESGEKKDEATSKAGSAGNSGHGSEQKLANSTKFDSSTQDGSNDHKSAGALKSDNASNLMSVRNQSFGINGTSEGQVFHEIENEGIRHGQLKKPRTGTQESASLLSPNMSIDVDLKSEETNSGEFCDNNKFSDDRQNTEDYSLVHNAMVHPDNAGTFGSYQLGDLSRYGQEPFTPRFSGSSGVSLTLGLQHTDGLSLSGTQQSYMSSQSLAPGRRHDLGNDSSDYCNIETSGAHPASTYENMQNRKRFAAAQLMRDFVA